MRLVGAVLTSILLVFAVGVQSNLICPVEAPHHHHAPCEKTPAQSQSPVCCWTLATCTSPAAPTTRMADADLTELGRVTPASMDRPRSIAFAPETPPPRA